MVSLCKCSEELDFLPADPYAARITALFNTYGAEQSFALFWVQKSDSLHTAAVSRVDGNMTVCACEDADFEELSAFVNAAGFDSLTCSEQCITKLGFKPQKTSYTVKYNGGARIKETDIVDDCDKRQIYDLLCLCGFELGNYGSFLADVCARLNQGTASLAAIEENDVPKACAFALFEGRKSVLLGAVATSPDSRGKGYASALVGMLAEKKSEKEVFIFCRNDGLLEFYNQIGFSAVGRWAIFEKE